jgi:3-phosphoshikimate 1-carboxyvinyltransferase
MADVLVPGSKSITNRALFLAAAAEGRSVLHRPLVADDTEACAEALAVLGYEITTTDPARWEITGRPAGPVAAQAEVHTRDGATGARFLPALAAAGHGTYRFDASGQMRRRPIAPLLDSLRQQGARIDGDALPYTLHARGLDGGRLVLDAGISSQYLTALLLAGPLTRGGLTVEVTRLVSAPYIDITLQLMRRFGATAERDGNLFRVEPGGYTACTLDVEPDASTASYFLAAAAVTGETVTIPGLGADSPQGDVAFAGVLAGMGAKVDITPAAITLTGPEQMAGITVDLHHSSDTMPTLAAIAPLTAGPVRIENIYNTRLKECDRLEACASNLRILGVPVTTGEDWIEISPAQPRGGQVATMRDHRIAMAFSVLGLRVPGLVLDDPRCVIKTCPGFHELLADLAADWDDAA